MHDAEMALTKDGRILGVHDVFLFDTGAYDPYGLTIPINSQCTLLGPVRHPELRERVHGRLHQQDDRHAGARRRPAARRVRQRAAARPRGARARHRSRRDSQAQPAWARPFPAQPRNHVSGLGAAHLRQRRLPADARAGGRDHRLRAVRARGAAEAACRRATRRRRRRVLRRRHRHRTVRRRARDGRAERQGARARPASARRGRDTSRCSRRSSPTCSASTSRTCAS